MWPAGLLWGCCMDYGVRLSHQGHKSHEVPVSRAVRSHVLGKKKLMLTCLARKKRSESYLGAHVFLVNGQVLCQDLQSVDWRVGWLMCAAHRHAEENNRKANKAQAVLWKVVSRKCRIHAKRSQPVCHTDL